MELNMGTLKRNSKALPVSSGVRLRRIYSSKAIMVMTGCMLITFGKSLFRGGQTFFFRYSNSKTSTSPISENESVLERGHRKINSTVSGLGAMEVISSEKNNSASERNETNALQDGKFSQEIATTENSTQMEQNDESETIQQSHPHTAKPSFSNSALELRNLVTPPSKVIHGNPLDHPMCQNALLHAHGYDKEKIIDMYHNRWEVAHEMQASVGTPPLNLPPTFWSRESLSAMLAWPGHNDLIVRSFLRSNWSPPRSAANENGMQEVAQHNRTDNTTRLAYIHLLKTGSSSVGAMLKRTQKYHNGTEFHRVHFVNNGAIQRHAETMQGQNQPTYQIGATTNVMSKTAFVDGLRHIRQGKDYQRQQTQHETLLQSRDEDRRHEGTPGATIKNVQLEQQRPNGPQVPDRLAVVDGDCTFAFVRDPIHRLISAYYTIHAFELSLPSHRQFIGKTWSFWNVTSEPQRFRSFVRELTQQTNEFVYRHPLQHAYTLSGNISPWFGSKIDFLGRVEHFDDHWDLLVNHEVCGAGGILKDTGPKPIVHALTINSTINRTGRKAVVLHDILLGGKDPTVDGKLSLPQYQALSHDQELFNQVVEHFWQDYVCFGYDVNYESLGRNYTGSFKKPY